MIPLKNDEDRFSTGLNKLNTILERLVKFDITITDSTYDKCHKYLYIVEQNNFQFDFETLSVIAKLIRSIDGVRDLYFNEDCLEIHYLF